MPTRRRQHETAVFFRRTETIDAGNAGYDDDIPPLEQGAGRRVPQLVDLVIDAGIFLDIRIRMGDVGFRLIVVVVADEIGDRVIREKLLEFAAKLRGQRLIVRNDERRTVNSAMVFAIVYVLPVPVAPSSV